MKNKALDQNELFKEGIRRRLEERIKNDWETEWSNFGDYTPNPTVRGSKFYEALAAQIRKNSDSTLSGVTTKRFIINDTSTKAENIDLICQYLGYATFRDFKQRHEAIGKQDVNFQDFFQIEWPFGWGSYQFRKRSAFVSVFLVSTLIFVAFSYALIEQKQTPVKNMAYLKLLHKSGKTSPAVYYLGVDLRGMSYDSAYVTFNLRPGERNTIADQERLLVQQAVDTLEYVVYKPEIIFAQLIVDGVNLGTIRLITYSDDWDGYYSCFLPETNRGWTEPIAAKEAFVQPGKLQYQRALIQNVSHRGYFYANLLKVADFGINLADADLLLNVRNAVQYGGISCFDVCIQLFDDIGNVFSYAPKRAGCPIYLATFNDKEIPLTFEQREKLTQDFNEWTDINLKFKANAVRVYINHEYRTTLPLPVGIGKLVEVKVDTKGMGELNYLDFRDAEGQTYYEDFGEVLRD